MARPHIVRLREAPGAPAADAHVIDARFKEVGVKRRTFLWRIWMALVAVFWAALIGFLAPPAIMLAQRMSALLN